MRNSPAKRKQGVKRAATFPLVLGEPLSVTSRLPLGNPYANQWHLAVNLLGCGLMTTGAKSDMCGESQSPVNH